MTHFRTFLLAALGLLHGTAVVVVADEHCYTNTTEIFEYLATAADGSEDVTVVLCPDTVFMIGDLDDEGDNLSVQGGTMPLIAFPRVDYLCGDDGSSSNNCVLQGGAIQLWSPPGAALMTASVQGITFSEATFASILLQGSGDVEFEDCIVQNHRNAAPVIINYSPLRPGTEQNVVFRDSVFADNTQQEETGLFTYGVITVTSNSNTLLIENCMFLDNVYDVDFGPGTYIIRSYGGQVDVIDSTFCYNSVIGFGLVEVFSYEDELNISGNVGVDDDTLTCSFLAVSETIPEEERQVTCTPFDEVGCGEDATDFPSMSPSMTMSSTPSMTPSVAATPEPTPPPTSIESEVPSALPSAGATPEPTPAPTSSKSPTPTTMEPTPLPSSTMEPTPLPSSTLEPTPLPSSTMEPTPLPSSAMEPTPVPSSTMEPYPTPIPSATKSPYPTPFPTKPKFTMFTKGMGFSSSSSSKMMMKQMAKGTSSSSSSSKGKGSSSSKQMLKMIMMGKGKGVMSYKGEKSSLKGGLPHGKGVMEMMMKKRMKMMMMGKGEEMYESHRKYK